MPNSAGSQSTLWEPRYTSALKVKQMHSTGTKVGQLASVEAECSTEAPFILAHNIASGLPVSLEIRGIVC